MIQQPYKKIFYVLILTLQHLAIDLFYNMPSGVAIESTQTQQYSHARSLVIGIGLGFWSCPLRSRYPDIDEGPL